MIFAHQSREQLRNAWREAYQRQQTRLPLEPLQAQMAQVLDLHPEYALILAAGPAAPADAGGAAADSAFLHLGLHLALLEQVGTDRPPGIRQVYTALCARRGDAHQAAHGMMEVLAQALWDAQRAGRAPDEQAYLERLRRL